MLEFCSMAKKSAISKYLAKIGSKGGRARIGDMTPGERKALATKASKAAAKKRTEKAQARKKAQA